MITEAMGDGDMGNNGPGCSAYIFHMEGHDRFSVCVSQRVRVGYGRAVIKCGLFPTLAHFSTKLINPHSYIG